MRQARRYTHRSPRRAISRRKMHRNQVPRDHASTSHQRNDVYMSQFDGPTATTPTLQSGSAAAVPPADEIFHLVPPSRAVGVAPGSWRQGPRDPSGILCPLSDRPLLCASSDGGAAVVIGGSDHVLHIIDALGGKVTRQLTGKRVGHSEWITGVAYLADSSRRIASAGMDGKVIVWDATAPPRGRDPLALELQGHFGSVSAVQSPSCVATTHPILVSSGYDKSVRIWCVSPAGSPTLQLRSSSVLRGHSAPVLVLDCAVSSGRLSVASGDRDGVARVWDAASTQATHEYVGHRGHVTSVSWLGGADSSTLLTGAQDGCVRVWDSRSPSAVAVVAAHTTSAGSGAVGNIAVVDSRSAALSAAAVCDALIASAGADKAVCVLDPRAGFAVRHRFTEHTDFIYSLSSWGGLLFSGAGDGMLICHDAREGKALWGIGANRAAVRIIQVAAGGASLVAAGDDGNALVFAVKPS